MYMYLHKSAHFSFQTSILCDASVSCVCVCVCVCTVHLGRVTLDKMSMNMRTISNLVVIYVNCTHFITLGA